MNLNEYNFNRQEGESDFRYKVRLCVAKLNREHDLDWSEIVEMLGLNCSNDHLRKLSYGYKEMWEEMKSEELDKESQKYRETSEILKDGSHKSDKLITMSFEQSKDPKYLLQAHGFDTDKWELTSARNNIWNVNSVVQGIQTLYSSKVTVKPKGNGFDMDRLLETVKKHIKPINADRPRELEENLLEIPLFDMHFGIADIKYYIDTYKRIEEKIKSKKWNTVLFVIGQDLLHNDGFTGKTTSGTMIDKVNTEQAWEDAMIFYKGLIKTALSRSNNVDVIYSNGNHDQGISYGFVRTLEAMFPQANFDVKMQQRKGYSWKDIFLGFSHGDKGKVRLEKNFLREYREQIAKAKVVEIHSGHLHHEITKDDLGIVLRTLATGAKTDDYHYENGWTGASKRFQIFEYTSDTLEAVYYV